jgi:hypothetical protein
MSYPFGGKRFTLADTFHHSPASVRHATFVSAQLTRRPRKRLK